MNNKKNIIFFLSSLDNGGLENYLLRFLKVYHYKFDAIYIWCKKNKGGILEDEYLLLPNIKIIEYSLGHFNIFRYKKLKSFIRKNKINVVCDFTGSFAGIIMLVSKQEGVKERVVFYRNSRDKFKPNFTRLLYRKLIQKFTENSSTKILSNSISALEYFYPKRSERDEKFKVIYNGIDPTEFEIDVNKEKLLSQLNIPKKAFIIGHVGRFNSQKNHFTILKVVNELLKKHKDIYVIFCGKDVENELPRLIQKVNPRLVENLRVLGNRNDVNKLLQIMSIFFFPSTIEGQPNALIEAMISGIPIVSSNINSIKETTPRTMHPYLKNPLDIGGYTKLIEDIYESKEFATNFIFIEWAKQKFQHEKHFKEFYNEIKV